MSGLVRGNPQSQLNEVVPMPTAAPTLAVLEAHSAIALLQRWAEIQIERLLDGRRHGLSDHNPKVIITPRYRYATATRSSEHRCWR